MAKLKDFDADQSDDTPDDAHYKRGRLLAPFISSLPDMSALRSEIYNLLKLALIPEDEKEEIQDTMYRRSAGDLRETIGYLERNQGAPIRDFLQGSASKKSIMSEIMDKTD